jgi:hypothetical protein
MLRSLASENGCLARPLGVRPVGCGAAAGRCRSAVGSGETGEEFGDIRLVGKRAIPRTV